MRNQILLFFVLIISRPLQAQVELDYDYYLLGTLSDYMGREKYSKIESRVDTYNSQEKALCLHIDSLFSPTYPSLELRITEDKISHKKSYSIFSLSLANHMNSFYHYTSSGSYTYIGENDLTEMNLDSLCQVPGFYETYFDTTYQGRLDTSIFTTDVQRLSFVSGAYCRYGWCADGLYYIRQYNSLSKVRVLHYLLEQLGCTSLDYEIKKGYIPCAHTVSFLPSEQLLPYLTTVL